MKNQSFVKALHLLLIAVFVAALTLSAVPAQPARADGTTSTSDLAIRLISAPKHARACQVVKANFRIENLGPDVATNINVYISIPDQFDMVSLTGVPESLAVNETAKVTAVLKVVAFVPGESRSAWIGAHVASDPYPNTSIDPNADNDEVSRTVQLKGEPVLTCP